MQRVFFTITLIFCSCLLVAQPNNPAGDPDGAVPITGIELLVGGGLLLGVKKLLGKSKEK